ncbi:MAG TPA: hypothetical protein VGQ83_17705 [Polyangia bacterium]
MARSRRARRLAVASAPAPAAAPPRPAAPPRARIADIPPLRYALYVAAAAVVHGVLWYLQSQGLRFHVPPGPTWAPHASLLAGMVLVRVFARHGRRVALIVGILMMVAIVRPTWGAALGGYCLVTWAIARLPLGPLARIGLTLLANAVLPAIRAGLLGPELASPLRAGPATILWPVLLVRGLMYQMEVGRLLPEERGFLCYLGSYAAIPLSGGGMLPPITYRRFIGDYGTADAERNVRAGLGLMALGALYLWLRPTLIAPWGGQVLSALGSAGVAGALDGALLARGRGAVGLALALVQVERYLTIAGFTFYMIGNLRLLGFNLASGYHYPFISRSFVDLWQRTNFYLRECQLVLYYVPVAKVLRRRWGQRGQRLTAGIAATAAIVGHLAVAIFLNHLIVAGWGSPDGMHRLLLDAGRFAVIGGLTILSVVRLRRIDHTMQVSWPRRIWQTVFVVSIAATNLAVWELMMMRLTWAQTLQVFRFVVGV